MNGGGVWRLGRKKERGQGRDWLEPWGGGPNVVRFHYMGCRLRDGDGSLCFLTLRPVPNECIERGHASLQGWPTL